MAEEPAFEAWAIVELMGHVRVAGRVTEETHFGATLGRVDVPTSDKPDEFVTQFFGGSSVYRITPVSEEAARQVARSARPQPIYRLELTADTRVPRHAFRMDSDGLCAECGSEDPDDDRHWEEPF